MVLHLLKEHADSPRVVAHPPLIYGAGFLVGLALDFWLGWSFGVGEAVKLGWLLVAGGLLLAGWSVWHLRKAGTGIPTNRPATVIVTDGPYLVSRNPIYAALTAIHIGLASLLDAPAALLALVPVLAVMHRGVILREEAYLEAKFGAPYRAYRARTRRYL
jgi:protein-S-isoprenylcysteine O-methyltransferase Ste14